MRELLVDVALPRTDPGVFAQAGIALVVFALVAWRVRRDPDLRRFTAGLATLTAAWFAFRALH